MGIPISGGDMAQPTITSAAAQISLNILRKFILDIIKSFVR
jgi:hypothetical protein